MSAEDRIAKLEAQIAAYLKVANAANPSFKKTAAAMSAVTVPAQTGTLVARVAADEEELAEQGAELADHEQRIVVLETPPPPPPPPAVTYFVSAAGSDGNDGRSDAKAWRTLSHTLAPGDVVGLRRGDTWSGGIVLGQAGTLAQPIVFTGYGDPALAAPTVDGGSTGVKLTGAGLVLRGLRVQNATYAGVHLAGPDCMVDGCEVTRNAIGVLMTAARPKVLRNRLVFNNRMVVNTPGGNDDYGAQAVQAAQGCVDYEVAYNYLEGNYASSYDYGWDGSSLEVWRAGAGHFHHNECKDEFCMCEAGGAGAVGPLLEHNLFHGDLALPGVRVECLTTRGNGDLFGPVLGMKAHHNTIWLRGAGGGGNRAWWVGGTGGPSVLSVRSNIIHVGSASPGSGLADADYNVYASGVKIGTHDRVGDPLFVGISDLRVRAGSPAIDAGDPALTYPVDFAGNPRRLGLASDAGAYERA